MFQIIRTRIPKGETVSLVYSLGTEDMKKKIHTEEQAILSCSPKFNLLVWVPPHSKAYFSWGSSPSQSLGFSWQG